MLLTLAVVLVLGIHLRLKYSRNFKDVENELDQLGEENTPSKKESKAYKFYEKGTLYSELFKAKNSLFKTVRKQTIKEIIGRETCRDIEDICGKVIEYMNR